MFKAFESDAAKINIILFGLAFVSVVASFNPDWHLWGLDSPKLFPIWLRLLLLVLLLILAIPGISARIGRSLSERLKSSSKSQLNVTYAVIALILVTLFIVFTSHNNFLGDGFNIMGNISQGRVFSPTEPFDYLVHHAVWMILGGGEKAAYLSYAYCSYACGILFLLGLYLYIPNKSHLVMALGVAACFAAMQFFFGYVENYSVSFIFMFFYSLSAIHDLSKKHLSFATIILLVLACLFEVSCVVLIPSALFLATIKSSARQKYLILVAAAVIGALAIVAYLALSSKIAIGGILVPFLTSAGNPYALFSIQHLTDILNLIFLNYPLLIVILIIGSLRKKLMVPFYLILIGPGIAFTILVDPKLGAFRDWDILAISAAPILAFLINAFLIEKGKEGRWQYSIFLALGLFGILHSGSWIFQNSSQERGYPIVKEVVMRDIHYSSSYMSGMRNKSWARFAADYGKDPKEVARAEFQRYLGDPNDTLNTTQLADDLIMAGDTAQAVEVASKNWIRFQGEFRAIGLLSSVMARSGKYDIAEQMCNNYLSVGKANANIYYNLGNIKQLRGQKDSSFYYYDKAYSVKTDTPIQKLFQFYMTSFVSGYDKIAESGFSRIMPRLPESPKAYAGKILDALKRGNATSIDSLRAATLKYVNQGAIK